MKHSWKRMSSGRYVDLMSLTSEDVDIKDIEVALNTTYRFNGHYKDNPPLTVAQHSYLCLRLAEHYEPEDVQLHKAVFIHDFAEAYIGDVSTPVKKVMGQAWLDFAEPIEDVVEQKFFDGLVPQEIRDRVKLYDTASLDIERRSMWSSQYGKNKWPSSSLEIGGLDEKSTWYHKAKSIGYVPFAEIRGFI